MRQILLFVAPLCLAACSIQSSSEDRDPKSTTKFIQGERATLTLNQMTGSSPSIEEVRSIAKQFIYDGANTQFVGIRDIRYNPSISDGYDQKGNKTLTLNAGGNGSALFVFNKKDRLREAMPLNAPTASKYYIIDGKKPTKRQ